jgi:AcrR family transcriptional regulator
MRNNRGQLLGHKGAKTRQSILAATRGMIFERAFRDISAVDIAKIAGVSVTTLYTYFEDVTAIVVALAEDVARLQPDLSEGLDIPWQSPGALERLTEAITTLVDFNLEHYPLIRLRNYLADEGNKALAEIRSRTAQPMLELLIRQIMTHGGADDAIETLERSEDARRSAGLLLGMVDRLTLLVAQMPYQRGKRASKDEYVRSAAHIILAVGTARAPEQG